MSDDPSDPDDWPDGEDRDGPPDDTSDDADLFADVTTDRAGDPFDELGAPPDETAGSADERGDAPHGTRSDPGQSGDDGTTDDASAWQPLPDVSEAGEARDADEGDTAPDRDGIPDESLTPEQGEGIEDPFGGPDPRGDPFDEDIFERQEVGDVDPDGVWEDLAAADQVEDEAGRRYAEVSKHTYCENCEWFSEPPEASCTHEGTEIVEFLDMETVRLLNCPVVAERRAIRDED